jgi:PAS domain S-box-containing protein
VGPEQRDRELAELRERLSLLSQASLRINQSLDLDAVLQGVLDSARSLTGARYAVMTLFDAAGRVQDHLASGMSAAEAERLWLTPDHWRLLAALADGSGPLRVPDLAGHVRALGFAGFSIPLPVGVFRFMSAPMRHRGVRVGQVFVGDRADGAEFTQEDEEILVMFAAQAALVIANARTHRQERLARDHLETLIDTSPVGVVVLDARSGSPLSLNREARRLVAGLLDGEQSAEDLLDLVACVRDDGREVSLREFPLAELLGAGETVRAEEIALQVPDGRSVAVLLNATPIRGGDGRPASFVVTLQDLTPLAEQERLRAEFLAMVSHELGTPLAAVKGSVATLLERSGELGAAETRQFHRIIADQSEQMRRLIGDLLDVARIETGALPVDPEPADLKALVGQAADRFAAAGAANPLTVDVPADLPMVMADRHRIVQVLGNLLANAAGYSPEGSPVTVSARRDGVRVALTVADEGPGIASESLPLLFRKFARGGGPGRGAGSGLGLSICRGIVEAHGGRIWAESEGPGRGARLSFTLPAAANAAPAPAPAIGPPPRGKVRVLAVDDDPQDLRYVREVLAGAGYAPIATGDPAAVPRLLAEEKPHLVLLDLVLGGCDGIELMNDIRRRADVPVVFLSLYGQDDTVARALDMGASDYLVKPFSPTELAARIRAALRQRLEPFAGEPAQAYRHRRLAIDFAKRRASLAGEAVELTATEYALLYELAVHAPRVLSHAMLLQRVWGPERVGEDWLVRDVVKRLRRKLGDDADDPRHIITEPRVGYRMAAGETERGGE